MTVSKASIGHRAQPSLNNIAAGLLLTETRHERIVGQNVNSTPSL
jgi:hypothetical protein